MREIEFRGKRVIGCGHVMVFGNLIVADTGVFIEEHGENYEVVPDTVGMYTGFNSSITHHGQGYGVKVYGGDIIDPHINTKYTTPMVVTWDDKIGGWSLRKPNSRPCAYVFGAWINECVVIGNIHENPDLLRTNDTRLN